MTEILDGREGPYARIQMEWYDAEEERRRLKWEGGDGLTSKRGDGDRAETRGGETIWGRDGQRAKLNGPKPEEAEEDLSGLESARTVPSDVSTSTEEPELELRGGAGSSRHRHYGHDWDPITLDCFSENDVYDDIEAYDREMLHRIRQQEPLDRERLHETRRQDLFDRERPCEMRQPSTVEPHSFRFDQQQHQESQSRRHDYYDDCRYCDRGENGLYNARQSGDGHGFSSRRSQRPQTSDRRRNGHESSRHQRVVNAAKKMRIRTHPDRLKKEWMSDGEKAKINERAAKVGQAADVLSDPKQRWEHDKAVRKWNHSYGDGTNF